MTHIMQSHLTVNMFKGKRKFIFQPIMRLYQFCKRVCTSVSETLHSLMAQLCFALVAQARQYLDLKLTNDLHHGLGTKLSLVTTTSNLVFIQTAHMNKYTVWTENGAGEFVLADEVLLVGNTVSFRANGKEVKSYPFKSFVKYNPSWKFMENTE